MATIWDRDGNPVGSIGDAPPVVPLGCQYGGCSSFLSWIVVIILLALFLPKACSDYKQVQQEDQRQEAAVEVSKQSYKLLRDSEAWVEKVPEWIRELGDGGPTDAVDLSDKKRAVSLAETAMQLYDPRWKYYKAEKRGSGGWVVYFRAEGVEQPSTVEIPRQASAGDVFITLEDYYDRGAKFRKD